MFKSMLGETDFFAEFSGTEFDFVATVLLVTYLVILTIMMLNLLVAVLTTTHARVDKNIDREFKVGRVPRIPLSKQTAAQLNTCTLNSGRCSNCGLAGAGGGLWTVMMQCRLYYGIMTQLSWRYLKQIVSNMDVRIRLNPRSSE